MAPCNRNPRCRGVTRRTFLADTGMGFTGLALSAMLFQDGVARADNAPPDGRPHFAPKAKSVIWLFMCGGVSHVESFDIKPELNRFSGMTIDNTPYRDALNPERLRNIVAANPAHGGRRQLMGLNTGFRRYGQSGLAVADWWRHIGAHADDIAVVRAYELAAGMQTAVPETVQLEREGPATQRLYGIDQPATRPFGQLCLAARRLVERGVRFVQVFHGGGGGGAWDAHSGIRANHGSLSAQVDLPIAGLLSDLKQRGLLDDTLVVWGTEFGRSPGAQGDGRDHHPQGFCAWLAGGGIKGGAHHGATDEIGFHAIEDRHYVTDVHATALHLLGLDARRLEVPGRRRLDIDYGQPIREIMS